MTDPWKLVIDRQSGELVSQGTVVAPDAANRFDVVDGTRPADDQLWDAPSRSWKPRPAPILRDRLDDIDALFQAEPEFMAVWSTLNTARRQQLRTGIRNVLVRVLRRWRFRGEAEPVEMGPPDA